MSDEVLNNKILDNIVFDDGFKELKINGDENRIVRWNPSDLNFVDRFLEFEEWLSGDELAKKVAGIQGSDFTQDEDNDLNINGYTKGETTELGLHINKMIDRTFGAGFTDAAFNGAHPMTPTASGFLFENFIEALYPIIVDSFERNTKAAEVYAKQSESIKKQNGKR